MKAFITLAALISALAAAPTASAWYSNFWRSPTRNISCRYYPPLEVVTCQTDNDKYAVAVRRSGAGFRTFYRWIPSYAPALPYGLHWIAPGFNCWSRSDGMLCRTSTGHGFFLSRDSIEKW